MAISASVTRGFTFTTGVEISAANLNELGEPTVTVATPIAVGNGGTNATSASAARTNLGLGTIATQASDAVAVTGGAVSGTALTVQSFDVAGAPAATLGRIIHVTNGDGGNECMAIGDGSYFRVILMGSTIST